MLRSVLLSASLALAVGLSNRDELFAKYSEIFPAGNRNAASHRWATYVLERAGSMNEKTLRDLFAGFCPVSGSPLGYNRGVSRWNMTLPATFADKASGMMYYCCWPCVCDTMDFLGVDTQTVQTSDGTKTYQFVVIGNPCAKPAAIPRQAPDVTCEGDKLVKATLSDHGHIIIGMFFEHGVPEHSDASVEFQQMAEAAGHCAEREAAGNRNGMGMIFREVAGITPIDYSLPVSTNSTFRAAGSGPNATANLRSPSATTEPPLDAMSGATGKELWTVPRIVLSIALGLLGTVISI